MTDETKTPVVPPVVPNPAPSSAGSNVTNTEPVKAKEVDPMDALKAKADELDIGYSNSISVEVLQKKIDNKLNELAEANKPVPVIETEDARRARVMHEHQQEFMALQHVRVTNMDPRDADLPGDIFTVANKLLGTVRRYIPFKGADEGWHIEKVLLEFSNCMKTNFVFSHERLEALFIINKV